VIIRAAPQGPVELAFAVLDGHVVDAREAALHQTIRAEFPVLVSIGAEPVAGVVMPLIGVAHGNTVVGEGPQFLDQTVVQFLLPFAGQELPRFLAAVGELGAVAPAGVERIGQRALVGIAGVQAIFGKANLLDGRFTGERGEWRTGCFSGHGGASNQVDERGASTGFDH